MKPEELMIGDWVYNTHHEKNICITPYDFFVHGHDENGDQYLNCSCKPCFGRDLEPIPLTPEILEKNGFEDVGQDIYQYEEKPYYIWWESDRYRLGIDKDESDYEKECFGEVMRLPIIYVHELQHALRLCGIEKKIEL